MTGISPELKKIVEAVSLDDVRLIEAAMKTSLRPPIEIVGATLDSYRDIRVPDRGDGNRFRVHAIVETRVNLPDGKEPVFRARATFELTYQLPEGFQATDDQLNEFAQLNALFNAWPYWREFVQNAAARMGLPPLILPVFRLQDAVAALEQQPAKTTPADVAQTG